MVPNQPISYLYHNDDGTVTAWFRNHSETYSSKEEIAVIVKRMKDQREQAKAPMTFPTLLS